jgi:hypothetical protein
MSTTTVSVPSITGAPNQTWKKSFSPFVSNYRVVEGREVPAEGSVGICFSIKEDLGLLWTRFNGDHAAIEQYLKDTVQCGPTPGFKEETKPITTIRARQVITFMEFALGKQPYFFLRKGRNTFGLYRKTRDYYYDTNTPHHHRIGFEFVRLANTNEEKGFYAGAVPQTVLQANAEIPV